MFDEFEEQLARDRAQADQAAASGKVLAHLLVTFHQTLVEGQLDPDLCGDLTNSYFNALLDGAEVQSVGDEDED